MIQRIASLGGLALLILTTPSLASSTYGEGVVLEESTPLADLAADPSAWMDSRLRTEGRVVAVTPMGDAIRIEDTEGNGLWIRAGDWIWTEELSGLYAIAEGDVGPLIPETRQGIGDLGLGPVGDDAISLRAVGAVVGEIEAIVMDGSVGVEPVIPPGLQGDGVEGPAEKDNSPEGGEKEQR